MSSDDRPSERTDPLRWLLQVSHTLPPAELGRAVGQAMARLGATATCLFLVDHDHVRMHPLGPDADELKPLDIDTTVAGRAFAWERTHTAKIDGGVRLWVPMIDGTARLGVVAVDLPSDTVDDDVVAAVEDLAGLAAVLVITKGHYTDAIERV